MNEIIKDKFFNDPDWKQVEALIESYIGDLKELDTIDDAQSAEHVKAELIGRKIAYQALRKFLEGAKLTQPKENIVRKNPFA
jgi:hypothetical protein